jgi:hypothetical protein
VRSDIIQDAVIVSHAHAAKNQSNSLGGQLDRVRGLKRTIGDTIQRHLPPFRLMEDVAQFRRRGTGKNTD